MLKRKRRGRPLTGREKKTRFQIMLMPTVAAQIRKIGKGNLSAGISKLLAGDLVDLNDWGILHAPRSVAEAIKDNNLSLINIHGELMAINERLNGAESHT